ncbi:hemolysin secretion protein D, partial [Francisella tularensis subsp. holarctica]|nr:hemolysin secretion protein D [Francisella tularensis subsp. holarctica]
SIISSESLFFRDCQNVDNLKIRKNDLLSDQKITQSKIDQNQYSLSRCSVKATTNGSISNFILEEGDVIKKGQDLFS